jgi:hypothetical protein
MNLQRSLNLVFVLAIAALFSGCMTTVEPIEMNPVPLVRKAAEAPNHSATTPTPSAAPTAEQIASLRAVGLTDQQIEQLGKTGNLPAVLKQVQAAGSVDGTQSATNVGAIASAASSGGASFGTNSGASSGVSIATNNTAVAMAVAPTSAGPSSSGISGSGSGSNLGGFGGFNKGGGFSGGLGGGGDSAPRAPRPEKLVQVVDLWVTSKKPDTSFGQFTYLLLTKDTTAANRERNLKLLKAALGGKLDTVAEQDRVGTAREKLNVVLIPMKSKVPDSPKSDAEFAAVLDAYDWAWANAMRTDLKFDKGRGPFLYSAAERWDSSALTLPECVKQDLSGAPDAMVLVWWTEFLNQSSRKDFWRKDQMQQVALEMREVIERAAEQLGESQTAVKGILAIIGLGAGSSK